MVTEIELFELSTHLEEGALLVDVREEDEIAEGAIPGMTHMPLSDFEAFKDKIPLDRSIVFYCRSGKRSMMAGQLASTWTSQPVYSLAGGYLGYIGEL
jgi:hydroxyacylglutathione hydrolase